VRAAIVLTSLLAAASAAAQMEGTAPPPILDPAQMSGTPRPDSQVPAGVLTIRVIHGELSAWAAAGTRVHLVGMGADGGISLVTREVNDEGRAEFTGLARDGLTAYYALCLLGEDRLVSRPVLLPPQVGVRMMLSGRKRGADGAAQGAPIDDEARHHDGVHQARAVPPAGEVDLLVRGQAQAGGTAVLRSLTDDRRLEAPLAGDEDALTARFTGLSGGADAVYVAEVTEAGRTYRSSPMLLSPLAGARRMVLVYDRLLFAMHGGGQPEEEAMWFELQMTVANVSGAPVDPGPDGLVLPLPLGFRSAKLRDENPLFTLVPGVGVRTRGGVAPGQMTTAVQFALPIDGGRVSFDMPAPLGMFQSQVALARTPGMVVSAVGSGAAPRLQRTDDGREYYVLDSFAISPGESLRFTVAGLPVAAGWEKWTRLAVGLAVCAMIVAALAVAVRRPRRIAKPVDPQEARRELRQRRERLYGELVSLERLRAADRIETGDFDSQRRAIMTKLVLVHRELEELEGGAAGAGTRARTS
jgi:hypothetical protein